MESDYNTFEDYFSNEVYATDTVDFADRWNNGSGQDVATEEHTQQLVFLYWYNTVIVSVGMVLNLVLIKGIVGARSNGGALYFVLQIALVDMLTLLTSDWEVYYHLQPGWNLPVGHCMAYSGLELLTSVALVYFIVVLNFHSIASYNLAVDMVTSAPATPDGESAAESLTEENSYEVATDLVSQKRSLTIDYRYRQRRIPVSFPILLVWFMAFSGSLPLFLFSDIVTTPVGGPLQCQNTVLVNNITNSGDVAVRLIAPVIRIILPTVALLITLILTVVKFYRGKRFTQPDEIEENVAFALKVSIFLSVTYALFTFQRLCATLLQEILVEPGVVPPKFPLASSATGLMLAVFHYSACLVRPLGLIAICKQKNSHVDITFIYPKRPVNNAMSLQ